MHSVVGDTMTEEGMRMIETVAMVEGETAVEAVMAVVTMVVEEIGEIGEVQACLPDRGRRGIDQEMFAAAFYPSTLERPNVCGVSDTTMIPLAHVFICRLRETCHCMQ